MNERRIIHILKHTLLVHVWSDWLFLSLIAWRIKRARENVYNCVYKRLCICVRACVWLRVIACVSACVASHHAQTHSYKYNTLCHTHKHTTTHIYTYKRAWKRQAAWTTCLSTYVSKCHGMNEHRTPIHSTHSIYTHTHRHRSHRLTRNHTHICSRLCLFNTTRRKWFSVSFYQAYTLY